MVLSFCDPGIFRFSKVGEKCRFHSVYWSIISIVTMIFFFFFHERLRSQYAGHACTDSLYTAFSIPCKIRYNLTRILYKKKKKNTLWPNFKNILLILAFLKKNGSNSLFHLMPVLGTVFSKPSGISILSLCFFRFTDILVWYYKFYKASVLKQQQQQTVVVLRYVSLLED